MARRGGGVRTLYHGTNDWTTDAQPFNTGSDGTIWFTPRRSEARDYADGSQARQPSILPVVVTAKVDTAGFARTSAHDSELDPRRYAAGAPGLIHSNGTVAVIDQSRIKSVTRRDILIDDDGQPVGPLGGSKGKLGGKAGGGGGGG